MSALATNTSPVGVFDSGIGGLSVLRALLQELPHEPFIYLADSGHAPYGERGDAYVVGRSRKCVQWLVAQGCQMVVVACNTATAAAIGTLRSEFAQLQWVGIEPALKPAAAATRNGHVVVFATRGTLQSDKFAALAQSLEGSVHVSAVPCDGLAEAIERGDDASIATKIIASCDLFTPVTGQFGTTPLPPPDVAVLGCTHYPLVHALWRARLPADVLLIDPAQAVARQARRLRSTHPLPSPPPPTAPTPTPSGLRLATTGQASELEAAARAHLPGQAIASVQTLEIP